LHEGLKHLFELFFVFQKKSECEKPDDF
jgi:hypothetical protein